MEQDLWNLVKDVEQHPCEDPERNPCEHPEQNLFENTEQHPCDDPEQHPCKDTEQHPCDNRDRYPYAGPTHHLRNDLERHSDMDLLKYVGGKSRRPRSCSYESKKSAGLWSHRILKELKELQNDNLLYVSADLSNDDIYRWDVTFPAPNGKSVKASIQFDSEYPLVPPTMIIKQRIFHPNISTRGEVCFQDLKNAWTPAHSIWSLILSVQFLLSEPNPLDPVNALAAKTMLESRDKFEKRLWGSFEMLDLFNDETDFKDELNTEDSEEIEEDDDNSYELNDGEIWELEVQILLQEMLEGFFIK